MNRCLTNFASMTNIWQEERARNTLLHYMINCWAMVSKTRLLVGYIEFIQKTFINRNICIDAKVEVLENMWLKLQGKLIQKNSEIGGKKT